MEISLAAEPIFHLGPLAITNSLLMAWLAMIVLILAAWLAFRKPKLVPRGLQNLLEAVIEAIVNMIHGVTGNRRQAYRLLPLVATIFLFVIVSNWMGLLPGVGSIGFMEYIEGKEVFVPLFRSTFSDLNMTLAIALISVFMTQFFGIAAIGFFKYAKKFINFSNPINFALGLLELVAEIAHVISFAFRLFGNVFAGEVLLVVIAVLVPYIAPLPFYFLEIFVGFIQALVFALLTAVFIAIASIDHEAHNEAHAATSAEGEVEI